MHFSLVAALNTHFRCMITCVISAGMNAAVRAVTRMGIYVGAKVYLIYEVRDVSPHALSHGALLSYWCMCFSRVIKVWWMEEITSNSPTGRASPTSFSWWVFICFNACLLCSSHACVMLPYVLLEVNLMKQFREKSQCRIPRGIDWMFVNNKMKLDVETEGLKKCKSYFN